MGSTSGRAASGTGVVECYQCHPPGINLGEPRTGTNLAGLVGDKRMEVRMRSFAARYPLLLMALSWALIGCEQSRTDDDDLLIIDLPNGYLLGGSETSRLFNISQKGSNALVIPTRGLDANGQMLTIGTVAISKDVVIGEIYVLHLRDASLGSSAGYFVFDTTSGSVSDGLSLAELQAKWTTVSEEELPTLRPPDMIEPK